MLTKEESLRRIKRLACSGLPVESFASAFFELLEQAVPHNPHDVLFLCRSCGEVAYLLRHRELWDISKVYRHFFIESPPEKSGIKLLFNAQNFSSWTRKTIWLMEELAVPEFRNYESFNVVYRPLGYHYYVMVVLRDGSRFLGAMPLWKSKDQKPFSREEIAFLEAVAPHLAHALAIASDISGTTPDIGFAPSIGWERGQVLMDLAGRVVALDDEAQMIFSSLGTFDGLALNPFEGQLDAALKYVHRIVISAFGDGASNFEVPAANLYSHWSGIVLRLRGMMLSGTTGREYISVMVERGETLEARQQRLGLQLGLTDREREVLGYLAIGKTNPEIGTILEMSSRTVSKHVEHLIEKMGVETRTAAAAMLLEGMRA